jgi:aspartyl-tRNA(Asn)/glutamyl-tRNA(Gln) amidotransferase subunit A
MPAARVSPNVARRAFLKSAAVGAGALAVELRWHRHAALASPADERVTGMTLRQVSEAMRARQLSSVDATTACLARIAELQPVLNAFITVDADRALADARQRDAERSRGASRGALHGVPVALKDNIDTAGLRTSAASALFADRVPAEDAEVVRRLKAAGVVVLGKLNMDEFGLGGNSVVTYWEPVRNPWAPGRSAGGSSGGAGAAVAAGLCFAALGTDTTGSLRIPAAFCGVVGLKPTYGRVSTHGVIPLSWTLDHVGPLARTVEDVAIVLAAIAGHDAADPASAPADVADYARETTAPLGALRLGIPRVPYYDKLDPEIAAATGAAVDVLKRRAAAVTDVTLPSVGTAADIAADEMYAYHEETFSRSESLYQLSTRRRLGAWSKLLAVDYIRGLREVERLRRDVRRVFEHVDVLVTPTTKIRPRTIEDSLKRAASEQALPPELGNTAAFNVLGLPAVSVPCGFARDGVPIGLQIVGPPFGEARVLALAHAYEQATPWHTRRPRPTAAGGGT